ncbi:hypothetical protein [Actibacterium lipolyticum]|nr:hypothetical protein [Actibacterium lipolyticum]
MKAIAEYFRDLAADDRYFGAEPPTPDADMLQRIAQRGISHSVEAHVDGNGIVLRADDAQQPTAVAAEPAQKPAAPQPAPAAEVVEPAQSDMGSVANKLARIRAAVDAPRPSAPAQPAAFEEEAEEVPAPVVEEAVAEEAVLPEEIVEEVSEEVAAEPAVTEAAEAKQVEDVTEEILEAINNDAKAEEAPLVLADEAEAEDVTVEAVEDEAEVAEVVEEEAQEEAVVAEAVEDEAPLSIERILAATSAKPAVEDEAPAEAAEDDTPAVTADIEALVEAEAETVAEEKPVEPSMVEEAIAAPIAEIVEEPAAEVEEQAPADVLVMHPAKEDEVDEFDKARDAVARARARVVKVKRSDTPEAETIVPSVPEERPADRSSSGRKVEVRKIQVAKSEAAEELSKEDEADLRNQLAAVHEDEHAAEVKAHKKDDATDAETEEAAVSRLVDEVNTKMDGPEHKRRRSAIAHLKAAVAATVAERRGKPNKKTEDEEAEKKLYRQDLADAVAQRTRQGDKPPSSKRMPPLMLVSEQRIDETDAVEMTDLQVADDVAGKEDRNNEIGTLVLGKPEATVDTNTFGADEGFKAFANRTGAAELHELLEAAAVYTASVEDAPNFTRMQVMSVVNEHSGEEVFSREDKLRAFGRLLREGHFERVERGLFTIAKESRFKSAAG